MKTIRTRKNIIKFIDEETVQKISMLDEKSRPYRLKIEVWALNQARLRGLNVPKVLNYYRDSKGREVIVLERIRGKNISCCTSQENADCVRSIGNQMSLLNNVSANYGWINPFYMRGINETWKVFISMYVRFFGERLLKEKLIKKNYLRKVYKKIELVRLNVSFPFLLNGDIRLPHIIRGKDGKTWIVDWENVILGDSLFDLAFFGVRYGHGILWQNLMSGYGFHSPLNLPEKYTLYEIIALIGMSAFYQKHRITYYGKLKKLRQLINLL